MQIRAAVTDGRGKFAIEPLELDAPQQNEVLVQIHASGACHTDYKGMSTWDRTFVMGHEGAGVVLQTGSGVTRLRAGERVLLNWAIPCGECFQCRRGAENLCENQPKVPAERYRRGNAPMERAFGLGTMATHAVVPEPAVVPIDVDIPFTSACILGCGVMTGFGSVVNVAKVERGSSVVVLGCGGVGLSAVQGARYCEAERIIAVDVVEPRLELARRFGATDAVLASRHDIGLLRASVHVKQMTGGRGADYCFECTAVPALAAAPLSFVRNGGTAVAVSGVEQIVPVNMEHFEWDKRYINPLYGQCRPARDFPLLLRLYAEGKLKLDEMVTRTYPLEALAQAFADMHSGANAKGVIVMNA